MKITYLGIMDNQFRYNVELNGHNFKYSTGLGHAYKGTKKKEANDFRASNEEKELIVKGTYTRISVYDYEISTFFISMPKELDVLECLEFDVQAGRESFQDFCDNFGYDSDSLKALDVYRACMDTATKLRGFKFPERLEA